MFSEKNYNSRLAFMGLTHRDVAKALEISRVTERSKRTSGDWRRGEIEKLINLLELDPVDTLHIFFA